MKRTYHEGGRYSQKPETPEEEREMWANYYWSLEPEDRATVPADVVERYQLEELSAAGQARDPVKTDEVEVFSFWLPADMAANRPKRTRSRWKITRADAAARYPGAECIEESREVHRNVRGELGGAGGGADAGEEPIT